MISVDNPTQKPPLGTMLDPEHPHNENILGAWVLNEAAGSRFLDAFHGRHDGTLAEGMAWMPSPVGVGIGGFDTNVAGTVPTPAGSALRLPRLTAAVLCVPLASHSSNVLSRYPTGVQAGRAWAIQTDATNNRLLVIASSDTVASTAFANNVYTVGRPSLFALTADGQTLRGWHNGREVASTACGPVNDGSNAPSLMLGTAPNGSSPFNGIIIAAWMWREAQSAAFMEWFADEPYAGFLPSTIHRVYSWSYIGAPARTLGPRKSLISVIGAVQSPGSGNGGS